MNQSLGVAAGRLLSRDAVTVYKPAASDIAFNYLCLAGSQSLWQRPDTHSIRFIVGIAARGASRAPLESELSRDLTTRYLV